MKPSKIELVLMSTGHENQSNDQTILHQAATNLRSQIASVDQTDNYPDKVSLQVSANFVPPLLAKFMPQLIDSSAY